MKHSLYPSLSAFVLVLGTLTLVGCGGAVTFSNPKSTDTTTPPAAQVVAGPAVKGTVYGGHAPLGGAHVYLLQPGTTGYGSAATSLLGSGTTTSPDGFTLTANVNDPNVPTTTTAYYETSDSGGNFDFTGAYSCTVGQPVYVYAWGGNIGGGAKNNNNIVQLATLGNCPSSGNFSTAGNGALSYIYLNEVSTVATAYTFQPFTLVTNNSAWDIGSTNTTQGLLGIANAANTAAQLYDIEGGTQISTTQDGEGHIANSQTLLDGVPNQGNGVVPQATIDTLANIAAACVDSTVIAVGTPTATCSSLFTVARDNGETTGVEPTDTGTALINIARFPAGNNSVTAVNANYAHDIFVLQSGTVPYVPDLAAAPNDWTIAINYPDTAVAGYPTATNNTLGAAESIAVDDIGQVFVTAQTGFFINRFSNLGVRNSLNTLTYIPGYVSVDGSNNGWTGNANCGPGNTACPTGTGIFEAGSNGVFSTTFGSGYNKAYTVITDSSDDVFFFAQTTGTSPNYAMFEYSSGGTVLSGPFNCCSPTTTTTTGTENITVTGATQTHPGNSDNYTYTFTFTTTGTLPAVLAVGDTVTLALTNAPAGIGGNAATGWQNLTSVTVATVNSTTNPTSFTAHGTTVVTNSSGLFGGNGATGTGSYAWSLTTTTPGAIPAGQNVGHGAIDSAGDLWITSETTGNTIARVNQTGTSLFTPIATAEQPEFPAIDHSNNAWIAIQETTAQVDVVSPTGGLTVLTANGAGGSVNTGALMTSTFGSAIDGNGNIWFANRSGNYGSVSGVAGTNTIFVINGGVSTPGTVNNAISPPTNYVPEAQYPATATTFTKMLNDSLNLAIDPSGNVWITNYLGSAVVEIVGAAAPVVTPLSVAAGNNQLGRKP